MVYNTVVSNKKGIFIFLPNSAWEPFGIAALFWGKTSVVFKNTEHNFLSSEGLKSAASSLSLGNRGYQNTGTRGIRKWEIGQTPKCFLCTLKY